MLATTEDGRSLQRKIIAEDPDSDLILLEGIPAMRGIDIAKYAIRQEHVRTFTHGNRFSTYRTEGLLIDYTTVEAQVADAACELGFPKYRWIVGNSFFGEMKLCVLTETAMASDALTVPGSSGGMVVNDSGQLVGVVSAGGRGFSFFVSAYDINHFLKNY